MRTGQQKHLGLQCLEHTGLSIRSSCAHTHLCALDSLYKVWLLPCSVCGLGQDVPFGLLHFVAEGSRYQLQVCAVPSKHSQGATLMVNVSEDKLDAVMF